VPARDRYNAVRAAAVIALDIRDEEIWVPIVREVRKLHVVDSIQSARTPDHDVRAPMVSVRPQDEAPNRVRVRLAALWSDALDSMPFDEDLGGLDVPRSVDVCSTRRQVTGPTREHENRRRNQRGTHGL
jgi:hypothetical protein